MNPMLDQIYGLPPEKSSLFYTLSGFAFFLACPVAFLLRKGDYVNRRTIIYTAMILNGFGCIVRTGNLTG